MLYCDYCNRIVDDRCDLCKYKEEAHEADPADYIGGDDNELERTEEND